MNLSILSKVYFRNLKNVEYNDLVIKSYYSNTSLTFDGDSIIKFFDKQLSWIDFSDMTTFIYRLFELLKDDSTEPIDTKVLYSRYCKTPIPAFNETSAIIIKHKDVKTTLCIPYKNS